MIQKIPNFHYASNQGGSSSAVGPSTSAGGSSPVWGRWVGQKHYSLEVVQHPIRARMCGFGDKDRRPLAPAAVAKMIVRDQDNNTVDVDGIDYTFFVVTVDLWSADGTQEMNLVLHPSSSDRYAAPAASKSRRRGGTNASQRSGPDSPASVSGSGGGGGKRQADPQGSGSDTPMTPSLSANAAVAAAAAAAGYAPAPMMYPAPPPHPSHPMADPLTYAHANPYPSDATTTTAIHPSAGPSWVYPPPTMDRAAQYQPPLLPPLHSFSRTTSSSAAATGPGQGQGQLGSESWQPSPEHQHSLPPRDVPINGASSFRTWPTATDPGYASADAAMHLLSGSASAPGGAGSASSSSATMLDPSLRASVTGPAISDVRETAAWSTQTGVQQPHPLPPVSSTGPGQPSNPFAPQDRYPPHPLPQSQAQAYAAAPAPMYAPPPQYATQPPYPGSYAHSQPSPTPPATVVPLPRHTYTRTLVGPLSSNACRLLDEHRKPGIFFLFQDLSIRTEGVFRLRLRLMNIGVPPAPEKGASRVHTDVSPILAQTFTEPFTVYSAKRFPGVPETTALSIAFGNQGQKLPLRNRHGPSKQGRKRRRDEGSEGSDDGGSEG